jgi:hypothetical protein
MNRINPTSHFLESNSPSDASGGSRLPRVPQEGEECGDRVRSSQVRWDLIRRLRREIAAGTYASQDRWQRALEGLSREQAG